MHRDDAEPAAHVPSQHLRRLALVALRSANGVLLAEPDFTVAWVNDAFTRLTGFAPQEALGQRMGVLLQRGVVDVQAYEAFRNAVNLGLGRKGELPIRTAQGQTRWALVDLQPMHQDNGALSGWVLVATDLTELRAQQQQLHMALDGAGLGTWDWDIGNATVACNTRLMQILGYQNGDLGKRLEEWSALIHPEDRPAWARAMIAQLRDETASVRMSVRLRTASGRWGWILFAGTVVDRSSQGRALRMAGIAMDVQAQMALEHELRVAARTDGLTQLPNRAVVLQSIATALARARAQPGYHFAVLFMDFDRFKQVNDTLGHGVGDGLLRQIAQRLEDSLRPGDTLLRSSDFLHVAARVGGDEFVVLLDDIRADLDAEIVASRLLDVLSLPYLIDQHRVNTSVSIGIVTSQHATEDADHVLRDADIAMYEAKRSGRARYVVFDPTMRQRVRASFTLENDLRQALAAQELSVVYQPLVDLHSGAFAGVEALLRWRHAERGMVSPAEFIPVAESSGLIGALGLFVLHTACQAFAGMPFSAHGPRSPTLSVNLSRAQLTQGNLIADVQDALRANGLSPAQLVLEVTESLAAQDEQVLATLHGLRALGVALSLDDFGTGYSSLSCLHALPVNFVKIDRSFVSQAHASAYHHVLIQATIRMAQTLGLATVAEGIETPEQAELMATLGCDKGQGYLYAKPLEAPMLTQWVANHNHHPSGQAAR